MEGKPENIPVMPSDELFESFSISALRLLNEELFFVGVVNTLCSPFQYGFHGYGFRRP
jgi:hypothetical protein